MNHEGCVIVSGWAAGLSVMDYQRRIADELQEIIDDLGE